VASIIPPVRLCQGAWEYLSGALTFLCGCDSLHAKITRTRRVYKGPNAQQPRALKYQCFPQLTHNFQQLVENFLNSA
jgi:hypothetical protein